MQAPRRLLSARAPMRRWGAYCVALAFPVAAVLHHAVFFRANCILNPFGEDYTLATLGQLLLHDPSIALSAVLVLGLFVVGRRNAELRVAAIWALLAFAPLALWLWDIPFFGRPICHHFHDQRVQLPWLGALRTRHFYALGVILWLLGFGYHLYSRRKLKSQ